jgi:hypothetical protein
LFPQTRPVITGDRASTVAAAKQWNELPDVITAAQSLTAFHRQLKKLAFRQSYPNFAQFLFAARRFSQSQPN